MKQIKIRAGKLAAIVLALTMAAGLTACGGGQAKAKAPSADEVLKTAQQNMKEIKSMRSDMTMELEMAAGEQALQIAVSGKMDYIVEPLSLKMDMVTDMGDVGKMATQTYMQQQDGKYMLYSGMDAGDGSVAWQKQELPDISAIKQMDARETFDLYLTSAKSFQENGAEQIGGAEATRYDGAIAEADLSAVMEKTGLLSQFASLGITDEQFASLIEGFGDLPVSIWVSKADTLPVRYEMDMTSLMQTVMDKLSASAEAAESDQLTVTRTFMAMTLTNINNVDSITVPQQALSAAAA